MATPYKQTTRNETREQDYNLIKSNIHATRSVGNGFMMYHPKDIYTPKQKKQHLDKLRKIIKADEGGDVRQFTHRQLRWLDRLEVPLQRLSPFSASNETLSAFNSKKRLLGYLPNIGITAALIFFFVLLPVWNANSSNKQKEKDRLVNEAKVIQEKQDCQTRAPYFQWEDRTLHKDGNCFRVRYPSKQACVDDGRQKSLTIRPEEYSDSFVRTTTCNDDGTWTQRSYDPEYEEYRQRQATRTICQDVTSYDYNWNNDMLCTRPDGSQFYTSYDGATMY